MPRLNQGENMVSKLALLALAVGALVVEAPRAAAFVAYTVDNPARDFTLFTYDSPTFITSDVTIPVSDLAYFAPPPLNFISQVQFIVSSNDNPFYAGQPEVIVDQYSGGGLINPSPAISSAGSRLIPSHSMALLQV
jgi:hypothetical protein